jgi:hypothetical protein
MALRKKETRTGQLELAANDANPDNGTRGRHGRHPWVEAAAFVNTFAGPERRMNSSPVCEAFEVANSNKNTEFVCMEMKRGTKRGHNPLKT